MNETQTIRPSKALSACKTGWLLVFQNFENGNATGSEYNYYHVPKHHIIKASGKGIVIPIVSYNGAKTGVKYLYINDKEIKGYANNGKSPNNFKVMTDVYEY